MKNSIRKFCVMLVATFGLLQLSGCATPDTFEQSLAGTKRMGIMTAVNHPDTIKMAAKMLASVGKEPDKNMDSVNGLTHYGAWDGWRWVGGLADQGVFEIGDIFEWTYPARDKEYGTFRLVTKWNDDKPGGCYWKGGFRYQSGNVVCDNNPEGPKLRRENAEWLRSKFGNS